MRNRADLDILVLPEYKTFHIRVLIKYCYSNIWYSGSHWGLSNSYDIQEEDYLWLRGYLLQLLLKGVSSPFVV